jgi:hypothetical protein
MPCHKTCKTDDFKENNDKCILNVPFHLWHYVFFVPQQQILHTIHHIQTVAQLLEYG